MSALYKLSLASCAVALPAHMGDFVVPLLVAGIRDFVAPLCGATE